MQDWSRSRSGNVTGSTIGEGLVAHTTKFLTTSFITCIIATGSTTLPSTVTVCSSTVGARKLNRLPSCNNASQLLMAANCNVSNWRDWYSSICENIWLVASKVGAGGSVEKVSWLLSCNLFSNPYDTFCTNPASWTKLLRACGVILLMIRLVSNLIGGIGCNALISDFPCIPCLSK